MILTRDGRTEDRRVNRTTVAVIITGDIITHGRRYNVRQVQCRRAVQRASSAVSAGGTERVGVPARRGTNADCSGLRVAMINRSHDRWWSNVFSRAAAESEVVSLLARFAERQ